MSEARAAAQKQTTQAFIDAWRKLALEEMVATWTPDCVLAALPSDSLGMPERNSETFVAQMKPMFGALSDFQAKIHSITNDGESGKSVIHARTTADTPVGPYRNEHITILSFTEDGKKVTRIDDMMDSVFVQGLQARFAEYFKQQAQS